MPPPTVFSRHSVLQGVFTRPFASSRPAIQPHSNRPANQAIQRRPGVDAFQVNLTQKSGGWPLPRDVQAKMESALGANFSDVRIHVGPEAAAIGAIAFTWGSDIHFAPGQYNPHTPQGQSLLGHELTHVVQQRAGRVSNPFGSGVAVIQDQALEAEADRLGHQAAMSRSPAGVSPATSGELASSGSQTGGAVNNPVITRKAAHSVNYAVHAPRPSSSGWQIHVAAQGTPQPVASVQLTASENGVFISNLRVSPEHRRHGLASQLIDAALRTARSNGYSVARLEARPDSPGDVGPGALVSMYQRLGFSSTGMSRRGSPLMERKT